MNKSSFSRRRFLGGSLSFGLAAAAGASNNVCSADSTSNAKSDFSDATFSLDGRDVRIYSKSISDKVRILQISDTHLYLDDERGAAYTEYSNRMAKAYNSTRNYKTNEPTNPVKMFEAIVEEAKSQPYDAIVLTGDIVSFPSAAGVDFVREQLGKLEIPFYYISGNHDWHFEGLPGTEKDLRDEWIEKRLKPLYPDGVNPLAYSVNVKGVKLVLIDDSIYEILPEQLEFLRKELSDGAPAALFMHIPVYAPGRSTDYGVGNPNWNAASDNTYTIERRPRWPEQGHTETTYAFRNEVLNSPNLLGVFAGHVHKQSLDVCQGKSLFVAYAATDGSTTTIDFLPM